MENNSKACSRCGEIKILDDFPRHKARKGGYATVCKVCQRQLCRINYDAKKKVKEEDPVVKLRQEFAHLTSIQTPENYFEIHERLMELALQISNTPTSVFIVPTAIFAEKSSMADAIILSKMPLYLIREFGKMVAPGDVKIQWSTDSSSLRVQLPDQIKLTKPQIAALTQSLVP